ELSDLEAGSSTRSASPTRPFRTRYPGLVRLKAYIFDGFGEYCDKEWDIVEVLKLQDILSLVSNGPYFAHNDGTLYLGIELRIPVPRFVSNLVAHIIDTHVDHLEDVVIKLAFHKAIWECSFDKS
ncbi:hypothetical protein Tco_1521317, partial [Tanacetum coccineum]